jgi:hypothetical protein
LGLEVGGGLRWQRKIKFKSNVFIPFDNDVVSICYRVKTQNDNKGLNLTGRKI